MKDKRPDAASSNTQAVFKEISVVYTYINLKVEMKRLIPRWLWEKKVKNVRSKDRAISDKPSSLIFKGEKMSVLNLIKDLRKFGYLPSHIHLMVRENGGFRIRVSWSYSAIEELSDEEIRWVNMMFSRFVWDTQVYRNEEGTGHLPPHISIGCVKPTERSGATKPSRLCVRGGEISIAKGHEKRPFQNKKVPGARLDLKRKGLELIRKLMAS